MRSSDLRLSASVVAALLVLGAATTSRAQQAANGFAVDRFSSPTPGSRWLVMDDLDIHGGLSGAGAFTLGYAHDSLRAPIAIVSNRAFAGFAAAATYERVRLSLAFEAPLIVHGQGGQASGYTFAAPELGLGSHPDTLSDVRVGFDARLFGAPDGPFRFGAGVALMVPSGERADYVTDGTYRGIGRAMFAGELAQSFAYAGFVGVHVRPLDDDPVPESPRGSELLFGVAAGPRFTIAPEVALGIGPELSAATAFRAPLGRTTTALEGGLTAFVETRADAAPTLRLKLGGGPGLHPHFGAAVWRTVVSFEVMGSAR